MGNRRNYRTGKEGEKRLVPQKSKKKILKLLKIILNSFFDTAIPKKILYLLVVKSNIFMFFTSAITSILPYVLFLGIMCTYCLGFTNEAITSNRNTDIDNFKSISVYEKNDTPFENNCSLNSASFDFLSENDKFFFLQDSQYRRVSPEYIKNRGDQSVCFYLFSRPPPLSFRL